MNRLFRVLLSSALLTGMFLLSGCFQGRPSNKPPVHINPNMDWQPKYSSQSKSAFFADGATMRTPPEGTVARDWLREDDVYYRGIDPKTGKFVDDNPVQVTLQGLERGRERFNIYCGVCHGDAGDAKSIMVTRKYIPPPTFHSDLIRGYPDGQIFDVISNGIRNMPSYKAQIGVEDRWLIINYLRALQRSQHASINDVPADKQRELGVMN
ncbi:c-type cytochrome [Calditrichota bacterium]